ncbi:MAG: NAD(P)-binding protein [candidate division WOR-3 bacterium]|nr:NAD(P)-binding protein [candidate division WOR-3 bacterium]MDW7987537.1 NAD(P)-binding protein [candidate division WOR-3 bacterium]
MKWLEKYKVDLPNLNKESDYPEWAISMTSTLLNRTGSWRTFRPVYENKTPPCSYRCPVHEKIPIYCDYLKRGMIKEAYFTIIENNPFPAITGRVCYHPCELECNRKDYDETLSIHNIERYIGDWGLKQVSVKELRKQSAEKSKGSQQKLKIAIIGSGPAGMTAAFYLACEGHTVTVYERQAKLGGLLRYGIPAYRLPKKILDNEINRLKLLGVNFQTGVSLGKDITLSMLKEKFDYVIIAYGAHKNRALGVPGDDAIGVLSGLEFLAQVNSGRKPKLGKRVLIIGGGNTAIDAARVALRLKRKPVILYRRSRNEMPANPQEVSDCEKEGIKIEFLVAPVKVVTNKKGKVVGLEVVKMKLGKPDASGRRAPVPIPNSNYIINCDTIITAIGEQVDLSIIPDELEKTSWGIAAGEDGQTNLDRVYAIGDCVSGPKTVTEAIAMGRKAAMNIMNKNDVQVFSPYIVKISDLNLSYFSHQPQTKAKELSLSARKGSFKEIHLGFSENESIKEAERCFSCGVCNKCDNCYVFCPDLAVIRDNYEYEIDYDFCKGCGVCAYECPRKAITMIEDSQIIEDNSKE